MSIHLLPPAVTSSGIARRWGLQKVSLTFTSPVGPAATGRFMSLRDRIVNLVGSQRIGVGGKGWDGGEHGAKRAGEVLVGEILVCDVSDEHIAGTDLVGRGTWRQIEVDAVAFRGQVERAEPVAVRVTAGRERLAVQPIPG